jgi:YHS domain-containing protein
MEGDGTMALDLVCKMEVDPKTAPAKAEYKGKTYCFCAPGCKVAFEKDPEKYVNAAAHGEGGHHHKH